MKSIILFLFLAFFSFSSIAVVASEAEPKSNPAVPDKKENKLTEEEINRMVTRVEEIRDIDKSDLTAKEKKALKKELREIKKNMSAPGGYVYIGATTLLLIIILVILFL